MIVVEPRVVLSYPFFHNYQTRFYRVVKGGGPRGGVSLIFPKVPQSSQTESLGFPSYLPPPLGHPDLKNPIIDGGCKHVFIFTSKIGEDEPILTNIFEKGVETTNQLSCF